MRSNYKKLGSYIQEVKTRNIGLTCTDLRGVSIGKEFMPSVANVHGTDLSKYKRVENRQFAFNPMHVGRDEVLPIALLTQDEPVIVSPAYVVFKVRDHDSLLPEYLMMWCRRSEFDRNAWFSTDNSVRGGFSWQNFCEMELPVPSIEKQREIVKEYETIVDRIRLNEQLNTKLEETAQAIYKHWFVDFEFPMSAEYAQAIGKPELEGQPYKSSGGEMEYNEVLEQEIPKGWNTGSLNNICSFSSRRISLSCLNIKNYVSTENMLPNKGGIKHASSLPNTKNTTLFTCGDTLLSNIRPYFKKIWRAEFEGGCSNDILCISPKIALWSIYIYYLLERDTFFDYVMAGSKGTKMPRGDKQWIMHYQIVIPDTKNIENFTRAISVLSECRLIKEREIEILRRLPESLTAKLSITAY